MADMELDMVADMEVDKVGDKVADMLAKKMTLTATSDWFNINTEIQESWWGV